MQCRLPSTNCKPAATLSRGCRGRLVISRSQAAPSVNDTAHAPLIIEELEAMVRLGRQGINGRVPIEKVQGHLDKVQALAAAAGVNVVNPAINDGEFEGLVTTDFRQISEESETTFGRLCFSQFQPADLKVALTVDQLDKGYVSDQFKGNFEGKPSSYVVTFAFQFVESKLIGMFQTIGSYEQSADMPGRLIVKFERLRLRQYPKQAADPALAAQWVETMRPLNPTMDANGVAEVVLPKPFAGHLDYLVMLPNWNVSKGNFGTVVVLKRRGSQLV